MIYQTFAKLYDDLMDPAMYDQWLDFVSKRQPEKKVNWLDLACGSGRLAVKLIQSGYQVSGFDLSEEMLALADEHAQEAGVTLPLIQGNMLDLSELDQYDVISCFADSFCYLPNDRDLKVCFTQVFHHLKSNGKLLFDVISPYQTDEIYPGYMYNYVDDQQAFLWTTYQTEEPHSVEHDLTFFIKNSAKNTYSKINELHHERTYDLNTYLTLLEAVGFKNTRVSSNFGNSSIDDKSTRWFFECTK
ncbi:methyltransferase domain-containing protein [Pediococcus ethanolidurans]|uniref:class I SAM-dependent DNA methyltransferase n=1 Tax=Pediococcus ethanolidurans TaxID=319653 RepID=UPI002955B293|nr:class I SAM-dependent methyltransferase [Pediococcus ethanolidurans]MDV7718791.1 methyltransferase domain-containing protein [Pediococcus ethanolidurans]